MQDEKIDVFFVLILCLFATFINSSAVAAARVDLINHLLELREWSLTDVGLDLDCSDFSESESELDEQEIVMNEKKSTDNSMLRVGVINLLKAGVDVKKYGIDPKELGITDSMTY